MAIPHPTSSATAFLNSSVRSNHIAVWQFGCLAGFTLFLKVI
ncbi:hypothetical protein SLEP1_g2884 [Rubroshorea leprosula]|uniref:Uncharacterized protein n=1 Tax=Rubroshorea leprosula TaxID=152421 RepID=A0AAV5HQ42_9ROSI|nr:hypothetical protein SLEP1_g2884 [Rubroshorea leprosula]